MPKVDCLVDGSLDLAKLEKEFDIDSDKPTVLYAPTRSVVSGTSLEHAGDEIIKTVCTMDVNFIIKLLDRNYRMWRKKKLRRTGGISWKR